MALSEVQVPALLVDRCVTAIDGIIIQWKAALHAGREVHSRCGNADSGAGPCPSSCLVVDTGSSCLSQLQPTIDEVGDAGGSGIEEMYHALELDFCQLSEVVDGKLNSGGCKPSQLSLFERDPDEVVEQIFAEAGVPLSSLIAIPDDEDALNSMDDEVERATLLHSRSFERWKSFYVHASLGAYDSAGICADKEILDLANESEADYSDEKLEDILEILEGIVANAK